jgi:hypothetical protein
LIKDAWHTKSWNDKLKIWFMPTGWRPIDVEKRFPVNKINNVYGFQKYQSIQSAGLVTWAFIQLLLILPYLFFLFGNLAAIGSPGIFYYGLFIFLTVYALTELMDGNKNAFVWELIKATYAIWLIFDQGGWFGAEKIISTIPSIIIALQLMGAGASYYFSRTKQTVAVS